MWVFRECEGVLVVLFYIVLCRWVWDSRWFVLWNRNSVSLYLWCLSLMVLLWSCKVCCFVLNLYVLKFSWVFMDWGNVWCSRVVVWVISLFMCRGLFMKLLVLCDRVLIILCLLLWWVMNRMGGSMLWVLCMVCIMFVFFMLGRC